MVEKLWKGIWDRGVVCGVRCRIVGCIVCRVVVIEVMVDLGERFYLEKWWVRCFEGMKVMVLEK